MKKDRTVGQSPQETAGMHGERTTQRASANQAAVSTTALSAAAGANPTKAEFDAVVTRLNAALVLVDEMRTVLVAKGIMKGSA